MNRESFLKKYMIIFNKIITETDNYSYDIEEFYGVILCYLNFYDYDNFSNIINELFKSKKEDFLKFCLFIILISNIIQLIKILIFSINLLNIKLDGFFERGLEYIGDIEIFINIMEKNKENFLIKYIKDNNDYLKYIIKLNEKI